MNLDLTVLGFIHLGHVTCPTCGKQHAGELAEAQRQHEADVLCGREANGLVCEECGIPLIQAQVAAA